MNEFLMNNSQWVIQILGQLGVGVIFFFIYLKERERNYENTKRTQELVENNTAAFVELKGAIDKSTETQTLMTSHSVELVKSLTLQVNEILNRISK